MAICLRSSGEAADSSGSSSLWAVEIDEPLDQEADLSDTKQTRDDMNVFRIGRTLKDHLESQSQWVGEHTLLTV